MSGKNKRKQSDVRSGTGKKINVGSSMRIKQEPDCTGSSGNITAGSSRAESSTSTATKQAAREKFLTILNDPKFSKGAPNTEVQKHFTDRQQKELLVKVINELSLESRIQLSRAPSTNELFYILIDEGMAAKYAGLDVQAKLVLQCIGKTEPGWAGVLHSRGAPNTVHGQQPVHFSYSDVSNGDSSDDVTDVKPS
jgi:hypothetical protein